MAIFGLGRKNFEGRDDTYIEGAMLGIEVIDVMGTYFTEHERDQANRRLGRYKENWRFYHGDHYNAPTGDSGKKSVINYCAPIVDKSADWLMGRGWKVVTGAREDDPLIGLLDFVWQQNGKKLLSWKMAQNGGVAGDVFVLVTAVGEGEETRIVIRLIDAAYVHPIYSPSKDGASHEIKEVLIQYPERVVQPDGSTKLGLYTQYMNDKVVRTYRDREEQEEIENVFGFVPLVHIQNLPVSRGFYGKSDIDSLIDLNREINGATDAVREVVEYHSAPITLIYGAKASSLQKGANKVWSGLPKDARVENLTLGADLGIAKAVPDRAKPLAYSIVRV